MSRKNSISRRPRQSHWAKKKSPTSASRRSTCSTRKATAARCSRWHGVAGAAAAAAVVVAVAVAAAAVAVAASAAQVALSPAALAAASAGVVPAACAKKRQSFRLRINALTIHWPGLDIDPANLLVCVSLGPRAYAGLLQTGGCASNSAEMLARGPGTDFERPRSCSARRVPETIGETCVLTR